jgi:hypothetical protein
MAARFPGAHPECIWIVGNFTGEGTHLSFPSKLSDPLVTSSETDMNEGILSLLDEQDFKVWLQVEPGNAEMTGIIHSVLERYGHHSCVTGFGVDVEWYKSDGSAEGRPVSDEVAQFWVETVRQHNPVYRLFLKHWEIEWMPPAYRHGLVFVDDSQQFNDFQHLLSEFSTWGKHFQPAPVAFQFGYPADKHWWRQLQDPPRSIGNAILEKMPNAAALFWVDFSIRDIFPE